jgi:hypothetical protein
VTTQPEARQVPLVERLEAVPADARLAVNDGPFSTSFHPVGAMAHEAAAELRRLHAANADLLEALRLFVDDAHTMTERERLEKARAAIAKAEEVKP